MSAPKLFLCIFVESCIPVVTRFPNFPFPNCLVSGNLGYSRVDEATELHINFRLRSTNSNTTRLPTIPMCLPTILFLVSGISVCGFCGVNLDVHSLPTGPKNAIPLVYAYINVHAFPVASDHLHDFLPVETPITTSLLQASPMHLY